MAHSYSHLFGLPTTGLRFFTVYGPWGRPDMAIFLFARAIVEGRPIDVFNNGDMIRDFTFIDDVVEGVVRALDKIPQLDENWSSATPDPATSAAPYRLYNIGNDKPHRLIDVIKELESALGRTAQKNFLPQQPGDMYATHANVDDLLRDVGYRPTTDLRSGIMAFADWFCDYYEVPR
jgi:UDP-glucuronate 4-epimerase